MTRLKWDCYINLEDISEFVKKQRNYREPHNGINLITSKEIVDPIANSETIKKLGLSIPD
ncbi:MAG: hypothetical protein F6K35_18630 [Okeania sp. SIO2H7]|nr:hypothetical protein [Okeania sp. SIO2H7]